MFPNGSGYQYFTGETGQGSPTSPNPVYDTYDLDVDVESDDEEDDQVFIVISAPHNRRVTVTVDPSEDTDWVVD